MNFHWPALITSLVLFLLLGVAWNVSRARGKYKVAAPATSGNIDFERAYRVQMNTMEYTLIFLPALWLFAYYVNAAWASLLGGIWLASRIWYAVAYTRDARKRGPAFGLSVVILGILAFGSLFGILRQLL